MILLEALLITLLLVTLIISSYTDCKFGTIKNKVLLFSTIVTLIFGKVKDILAHLEPFTSRA